MGWTKSFKYSEELNYYYWPNLHTMSLENIVLIGTFMLVTFLSGLVFFVIRHQKNMGLLEQRRLALEEEKNLTQRNLEIKLAEAAIKSQEIERKKIGEGLHDEIAPMLSAIRFHIKNLASDNPTLKQSEIQEIITQIDNSIKRLREVSHFLHPAALQQFGLSYALKDLCGFLIKAHICNIEYDSNYDLGSLDSDKELMLLRIIQELIFNAVKHGNSKIFELSLQLKMGELFARIQHDGIEFTSNDYQTKLYNSDGLGLKNIQHRLNLLQAKLSFEQNKGLALTQIITICIPVF